MKTNFFSSRVQFLVNPLKSFFLLFFILLGINSWGQKTWLATSTNGAWYTIGNWDPSGYPTSGIATFGNTATGVGINLGTRDALIGAINYTSSTNLRIGNSSGSSDGTITMSGASVNSVANVIIRNSSTGNLTLAPNLTTGSTVMEIVLGNTTNNIINIDGSGGIIISTFISGAERNLTLGGSGTGTLTLSAANTYTGTTTINANKILVFGVANTIANTSNIILNGGTIKLGTGTVGVTDQVGTLNVNANSTIALGTTGATHTLTFANSSAISWAGATITVTGWAGTAGSVGTRGRIFVGNNSSGLTTDQLAKFRFTGYPNGAQILSNGEIVPTGVVATPAITLANNGTQVVAGNVIQGAVKHPISSFQLSASSAANANLTEARFITSGNYRSTDVSAFKLWYNTTDNLSSATQLGASFASTSTGSEDIIEFTGLSQQIALSSTRYFWVTADVTSGATAGRTMSLDAIANTDLIFSSGTKTGSANSGGTQTIVANTIPSLAISGTPTAHGTVCVGTPAITRTYTISNTGATANGISVSSNNPEFVVSNLSSTTIANGSTATFDVTFTPTTAGERLATVTVASATSGSNAPTLNLSGTGTANVTPTISIISNLSNTTICAGTSVTFTANVPSANLGGGTASYQWKLNGNNVGSNATTYTNSTLANGDIVACVLSVIGGCVTTSTVSSNAITMTVNSLPLDPNGDISLENPYCDSAELVYELGDKDFINLSNGVLYYWQTTANGISTANPMVIAPGAEASNPYNVTVSRIYYVRAYNGSCWSTMSYATAEAVSFVSAISVSTQPANQLTTVGSTATFTVVASGSPTYQWQLSTNNGAAWTNITSATTASYTTASTTLAMNGYRYRVRLSNSCGTINSDVATLTINDPPVSIWSNTITGTNPSTSNPYTTGDVKNANITVSGIGRGAGIVGTSAGDRYNANGWDTTSIDTAAYFEFTLTPNANYKIDFDSFDFTGQRSNTGPTTFAVRSSVDGFINNIGNLSITGTTANSKTVDISGSDYKNITSVITFRIYGWGASASTGTFSINDFDFKGNVTMACVPATVTAFPTSGPANTVVIISGTDFDSTTTVKFGTVDATTVEYISATELKATVPATADGNIIVDTALDCDSETAFTLIKENAADCEILSESGSGNASYASDLILYEVYDENGGVGGTISIYNGTSATVDLSNYSFYRHGGETGNSFGAYGVLTGTVASGELALIGVTSGGGSRCGVILTNGTINSGFNDKDGFQLRKNSGNTIVDEVWAPNFSGYYLKRKPTNLSPKPAYDANDRTETSVASGECIAGVGAETPGVKTPPPTITAQPSYTVSCEINNTSLALTATEGYDGGNTLAYQWYVLETSGSWTAVSNGGVYSGATTETLVINDITGLNNYQYYCQVRENTETCYTATQATQIKEATNTWSNTQVWSNGTPILASKVIIAGSYDTQANGLLDVCELTVGATGSMVVKADNPITVKKKIINQNPSADSFVMESDANIIQTDDVVNEGNILVQRSVADMNNVSTKMDYVYWSSPVEGQTIKGSGGFSPNTPNSGFQQYNESTDRFVTTNDATFLKAKGYAIRAESGVIPGSNPPEQYQDGYAKIYAFAGVPNNGSFQSGVLGKSGADKGYNLIGNPYPSNIDFDKLHALNESKIYATAFFWTNNEYEPKQMGSGYKGNNYAIYNITGGVPATYDSTNPNYDTAPNGKVKLGQAFIVQTKIAGALDFNNSIRVTDSGTFYQKTQGKNRFWLTLTAPNNMVNTILVGYIAGATDLYETDFDAELLAVGSDSFYSILGAQKLAIQGKVDRFSTEDVVALGNVFSTDGNYTIKLQNPEGLFNNNQNVYLKDKLLKKYINLSTAGSYTFEAVKGTDHTRFEIVYKEGTLDATDHNKSEFQVYKKGVDFVIQSSRKLGKVELYDAGGRLIRQLFSNEKNVTLEVNSLPQGVYIIKVEISGDVKTKKIVK